MSVREFSKRLKAVPRSRRVVEYRLGFFPSFWRIRHKLLHAAFELRAMRFRRRLAAGRLGRAALILGQLLSLIAWKFLVAIFVVAGLAIVSSYSNQWLAIAFPINDEAEINYLGTLGQVSAGFLALYF